MKLDSTVELANRMQVQGNIERFLISDNGYFLLLGWLADEGHRTETIEIVGPQARTTIQFSSVLRSARPDIETHIHEGNYDYGFTAFGRAPKLQGFQKPLTVRMASDMGLFQTTVRPEIIADTRLLDMFLLQTAGAQCHAGTDAAVSRFLREGAATGASGLFARVVDRGLAGHQVLRFRPRQVDRSFATVLFGTAEPVMIQPVLFRQCVDPGEWIYVCNSPEHCEDVVRYCRTMSELYDLSITAILPTVNVGFGAANNLAVQHASSDNICLVNPDVYPMKEHAASLAASLLNNRLGVLRGGLLFYDPATLMHSGMFIESDPIIGVTALSGRPSDTSESGLYLLRVEHFDKGIPFDPAEWEGARQVPAVSGATMAFNRRDFERIGGFSSKYIYGHYEDADLSLRWWQSEGSVVVDPQLRLIHLEGQGSRSRGAQYLAAAIINRHLFSISHGELAQNQTAPRLTLVPPHHASV